MVTGEGRWRPRLCVCPTTHYYPAAGKGLTAILVGLIARVGNVGRQRLALTPDINGVLMLCNAPVCCPLRAAARIGQGCGFPPRLLYHVGRQYR